MHNPLTPEVDPFPCNNKLAGGAGFLETYNSVQDPETFGDTARDSDGHGTHTTSTAAGGIVEHADPLGVPRGPRIPAAPGWRSVPRLWFNPSPCSKSKNSPA